MNRPITLVCYICGREFGTKSLAIHIKACEKKWENEENLKPPKQRRPCPKPPAGIDQLLGKDKITKQDINNFNTGSFNTFKDQALVQCQFCGRKFNPKSLAPHQKACRTNPMIRKPYVSKLDQKNEEQVQDKVIIPSRGYNFSQNDQGNVNIKLTSCSKCGRNFAVDRVMKHEKVCKGPEHKNVIEKYQPTKKQVQKKSSALKKPKWKIQSEQLQNAMKMNRQMKAIQEKGGNLSNLPPPQRSNYDHYIECKYCGRKYAPDVAQRHIPKCATIVNKPSGIKPSTIGQKYVGTTAMKSNLKPTIQTTVPSKISQPVVVKIGSSVNSSVKPSLIKKR